MELLTVVPATSLELSFGCYLLGFYDRSRRLRADGRKACEGSLQVELYDRVCEGFMKDPDGYIEFAYEGDLEDLLDHARELVTE